MSRKIIFIMGAGRSGTTLLDILLGNHNECVSIGEINRYFNRLGEPHESKNADEAAYWESIKQELENQFSKEELIDQRRNFKRFEYYSGVFVPKLLFGKQYRSYLSYTKSLLEAIQARHTDKILVDSSKYPLRVSILKDLGYDVRTVYLIRRPSSVIRSFMKKGLEQPSKGFVGALLYYTITNLFCYYQRFRHKNSITVTYENLVSKTSETLDRIASVTDLDMSQLKMKVDQKKALKVGYLFDGNRIRLKNEVVLENKMIRQASVKDKVIDFLLRPIYRK